MHLHFQENTAQLVLLLFLVIVFIQSGVDKVVDWKGNLNWLKEHFSKTPFKGSVPVLLGLMTLMELVTGLLALLGFVHLLFHNNAVFAFWAAVLGGVSLLFLLLGQRIAKDYEGAKTIVIYLIATAFLIYLLQ